MKRRFTLLLTILICFVMVLSGCNQSNEDNNASEPKKEVSQKNEEEVVTEVDEENKDVEVLIGYNVNVETFAQGTDTNSNIIIDWIRENSGYNVTVSIAPKEGADQKVAAILAANDTPDLIINVISDYAKYASMGALLAVDDLLSEAPTLEATISEELKKAKMVDGKLYMIPVPRNFTSIYGIYTRIDWLSEYGSDVKTLDDYYNFMVWLKETKDVIPLTADHPVIGGFAGAFGLTSEWIEQGDELVSRAVSDSTKDYLTFMNKLYEEGLLDAEFFVNTTTNVKEKLIGGTAAIAPLAWWDTKTVDTSLADLGQEDVVNYIAPPIGEDGAYGWAKNGPIVSAAYIPSAAKNPLGAIKLMDFVSTEEAQRIIGFGFMDEHYTETDGVISPTDKSEDIQWRIIYQWNDTQWNFNNRVKMKGYSPKYFDPTIEWAVKEPWSSYAPPIDSVAENSSELKSFYEEQFTKFIIGERSLDEFDAFVEEYNEMGGAQCNSDMNDWWKDFN